MNKLFVFCDGTNNTLTAGTRDTNVLALYEKLLNCTRPPGEEWTFYYDPGVGSASVLPPIGPAGLVRQTFERLYGLALGHGIFENIGQAYLFLMRNIKEQSDHIYICGFSRGAFTARAVTGMVNLFGILRPEHEALIPTLLHVYFSQADDQCSPATDQKSSSTFKGAIREVNHFFNVSKGNLEKSANIQSSTDQVTREEVANQIRKFFTGETRSIGVHWVGVWDTVESVGLPGIFSQKITSSKTIKSKNIRHVRHAISCDEHRYAFKPRYYEDANFIDENQSLIQRWFDGCHCDVGGSYAKSESILSDSALAWIADEMFTELGVTNQVTAQPIIPTEVRAIRHDPLWDMSWWALAGMIVRRAPEHHDPTKVTENPRLKLINDLPGDSMEIESVWQKRRPKWSIMLALTLAVVTWLLSGPTFFPRYQVSGSAGWLGVLAIFNTLCWGFLLARITSRGFNQMVRKQQPFKPEVWWTRLGYAPMISFAAALIAEIFGLLATGLSCVQLVDTAEVAYATSTAATYFKWLGLGGCSPLMIFSLISYIHSNR